MSFLSHLQMEQSKTRDTATNSTEMQTQIRCSDVTRFSIYGHDVHAAILYVNQYLVCKAN